MAYPTVAYHLQGPTLGLRPIAETSDTQHHPLGTMAWAQDSTYGVAQFLYLAGVASTAPGDVVAYNSKTGATVRVVAGGATSTGPVGVAMSANLAGQYGWVAVFGSVPVAAATVAADAPLYLTSTAGTLDDTVVAGDKLSGIISRAATSAGFATCQLAYPELSSESSEDSVAAVLAYRQIVLTAAAEDSQAIVVTGQVKDLAGVNISAATQVLVRSLAITADKGDITVTAGTEKKTVNPATGENVSWIETTASGGFAVSIANDVAENTLVQATADDATAATLKLVFA